MKSKSRTCAFATGLWDAGPSRQPSNPTLRRFPEIIAETMVARQSERATRVIDHDQESSMEIKKREGYF